MQGGMEAVYDDITDPIGFMRFAPVSQAAARCSGPLIASLSRMILSRSSVKKSCMARSHFLRYER